MIGDRANRETLDIYERTFAAHPDAKDLRWRIEHAQHLHPDDIPRFAKLGVIPAMQGVHCTSDAPWVLRRLGAERAGAGAYVWRQLLDSGAVVTNGTDAPVEDVDPIKSYYSTVTRRLADGTAIFYLRPARDPHGGAALVHDLQRLRRQGGGAEGRPRARKAGRRRRPLAGHPHMLRRGDPRGRDPT